MGCYENIIICMNIYLCLSLLSCSSICMAIYSALISSSTCGGASYLLLFCFASFLTSSSAAAFFSLSCLNYSRSSRFSLVSLSSSFCWALDLTRCPTSESLSCFTVVRARASSSLSFLTSYLSWSISILVGYISFCEDLPLRSLFYRFIPASYYIFYEPIMFKNANNKYLAIRMGDLSSEN